MRLWWLLSVIPSSVWGATADQWAVRSIYQLVTDRFALSDGSAPPCNIGERKYCGGTWQGIKNKLDYIKGMGFDSIWISPVVQNFDALSQYGQAYHGYWTQNINHLNSHFGTPNDLRELILAVHAAGMYIMVDITINSMAWPGSHDKIDYSSFASPFNSAASYHPFCWIDYTNATSILDCWVGDDNVALLDVDTKLANVQNTYQIWIQNLLKAYQFDGIRIDALKSVEPEFFPSFLSSVPDVFAIGENFQDDPNMCCAYQSSVPGLLNFPVYWGTFYAFTAAGGGIQNLVNLISETQGNCSVHLLGNFIENHDLKRYAGVTSDQHQRINALAFSFVNDGIPIAYYGQEQAFTGQEDPYNREALWVSGYDTTNPYYTTMATLNAVRKNAIASDTTFVSRKTTVLQHDIDYIVLKKGDLMSILSNDGVWGSNETLTVEDTGYPAHTVLVEVYSQEIAMVDGNGHLSVRRKSGAPLIYWPRDKWDPATPKPNTKVEIDTRTTATTTMTTTYVYPSLQPASAAVSLYRESLFLQPWALMLSIVFMALTIFMVIL